MGDSEGRGLFAVAVPNAEDPRIQLIREKIHMLEVIRNHLHYTLRYEHRFHLFDVSSLQNALNRLQLVIDMYTSKLDVGDTFWGLNKAFFHTFEWIEKTFKDDLESGDNRRISVIYIYLLNDHLQDLIQMFNESLHSRPSLFYQMFNALMNKKNFQTA